MTLREAIDKRVSEIGLVRGLSYLALTFVIVLAVLGTCGFLMDDDRLGQAGPLVVLGIGAVALWAILSTVDSVVFSHRVRCPRCDGAFGHISPRGLNDGGFDCARDYQMPVL